MVELLQRFVTTYLETDIEIRILYVLVELSFQNFIFSLDETCLAESRAVKIFGLAALIKAREAFQF